MRKRHYINLIVAIVATIMLAGCDEIDESIDVSNRSQLTFSTTDIDGNTVSIDDFSDSKLIMINFWEPWCGPCVQEMPDLERLYEEYQSDGLMILGVYSTLNMDAEVKAVLESCGTTYPILRYNDEMEQYSTDYVPTTIFVDQQKNVLTTEPIVGGNSYDNWKEIIEDYMGK